MENTIKIISVLNFCAVFMSSPRALVAFSTNQFEEVLSGDDFPNNVGINSGPEPHLGRLLPSYGTVTFGEASPSSPSATADSNPNSNVVDQISQIFGIPLLNDSGGATGRQNEGLRKDGGTAKFMLDLYRTVANTSNGETFGATPYDATTIRSLTLEKGSRSNRNILHFNVESIPETEKLLRAELHLFRLKSKLKGTFDRPKFFQVGIYQRTERKKHKLIDQRLVSSRGTGREVFNVDSSVLEWLADSATNNGLYINVTFPSGEQAPEGALRFSFKRPDRKPTLLIYTREEIGKPYTSDDTGRTGSNFPKILDYNVPFGAPYSASSPTSEGETDPVRTRREIKATYSITDDLCRLETMYVDFVRLGWNDRIIAPDGFFANKCIGSCPFPDMLDDVNALYSPHALLQSVMAMESNNGVQTSCCVPLELGQLAILFVEGRDNIVLRQVKNTIALQCGCH